jgi:formate dehydrogenase major subunit
VWSATDYLRRANTGDPIETGNRVVVVGGGNTAIDVARLVRRRGAKVTLVYRRTRAEMPARAEEFDEACEEGVAFEFLVSPVKIERDGEAVRGLILQRMRLGEPDDSGRRRPLPVDGAQLLLDADTVIAALSQAPDWDGMSLPHSDSGWARADRHGRLNHQTWAAGDVVGLGPAGLAIGRARLAAEALHARLRGLPLPRPPESEPPAPNVKPDYYPARPRAVEQVLAVEWRLERPAAEVHTGLTEAQFHSELERCMSCGECFGCEHCWIYCAHECFSRLDEVRPGSYFSLAIDACQTCGKCVDLCPCGYLQMRGPSRGE